MEMITTCPHCVTSFRVTPDHLRARAGQVRCGRCAKVFDAFATLTTREAVTQTAAAPVGPEPPAPPSVLQGMPASETHAASPMPEPATSAGVVPTQPQPVDPATVTQAAPAMADEKNIHAQRTSTAPASPVESVAPMATAEEPVYAVEEYEEPKRRNALWAIAALLALIALAGQAAYVYSNDLVSKFPELKTALTQFCEYAGCKLLPLQRPEVLKIEASDLQVTDPSKPTVIQLTATLRNYSSMIVGYPTLDLVLTDNREHTLVRRMFAPAEYLARADASAAGIASNAEVTVRIDLDVGTLGAAGFRLNLAPFISN